jgi:hypothetical protein
MVVLFSFVHPSFTAENAEEEGQATTREIQTVDTKGSKSYWLEDQRICTRDLKERKSSWYAHGYGSYMYVYAASHSQKHKVEVNFILEQTTRAQRESRGVAIFFL